MKLGTKLKERREALGITQEAMAETLGVSRQTISNWETGKTYPDILCVIKISDLCQVSLDELLKEDEGLVRHLDSSTNTVKSHRRYAVIGLGCILGLALVDLLLTAGGGASLGSGNVPDGAGGAGFWPITISGPVFHKLLAYLLVLAGLGLLYWGRALWRWDKTAPGGTKAALPRRGILLLALCAAVMAGVFLLIWISP